MEFVFLLILVSISISVHLLLKLKIEQSIFFTVCSFFIIMFLSGLITVLSVGYYIIIAMALASVFLIAYKSFKKEIDIFSIITPGAVIFVAAFTVYYFSTQSAMLHLWDESTHWGIAAKKMYYKNDLWTSGLQTIATPVFNQVMLKTTGYSESSLYVSQWVLYLACMVLPLSAVKWKRSYLAAIYSAAVIFAVSAIFEDGNLTLYADGILAFFFASILIAWYLEKERDYKRFIWAGIGIFTLVQIKSGSGMSLAAMFLVFAILNETLLSNENIPAKAKYLNAVKSASVFALVIFVSYISYKIYEEGFSGLFSGSSDSSNGLYTSIMFMIFAALMIITVYLFIKYSVRVFKGAKDAVRQKKTNKLLVIFAALTLIAVLGVLFYSTLLRPNFDVRTTFINFLKAFQSTKILGISVMYLIAAIIAAFSLNIIVAKEEDKKDKLKFYISVLIFSGLYVVGVLYAYLSSFSLAEAVNTASFERYVGTALMFAVMFVFMPLIKDTNISIRQRYVSYIPAAFCFIYLLFFFIPSYEVSSTTSEEALVFRQTEINALSLVEDKVTTDDKVFLVIQDDEGFVFNWMRYEFTPIRTNGGYWSYGIDGGWNFAWNEKQLTEFLDSANYDYLYLFKSSDYFVERFGSLFGDNIPESKTLYKFCYGEEVTFVPVE